MCIVLKTQGILLQIKVCMYKQLRTHYIGCIKITMHVFHFTIDYSHISETVIIVK